MPNNADREIRRYLNSVDRHLGHLPPGDRRAVLNNLESHMAEALRQRLQSQPPSADDVRAVIAEMDPPESFDADAGDAAQPRMGAAYLRNSILALVGGLILTAAAEYVLFRPLVGVVGDLTSGTRSAATGIPGWMSVLVCVTAILVSLAAVALCVYGAVRDRLRRWVWIILAAIGLNVLYEAAAVAFARPYITMLFRDLGR